MVYPYPSQSPVSSYGRPASAASFGAAMHSSIVMCVDTSSAGRAPRCGERNGVSSTSMAREQCSGGLLGRWRWSRSRNDGGLDITLP
jgi:hypothetical protein